MQKILVEIIGESGIRTRKKYEIEGDTVKIRKGVKNHPAWKPKFSKESMLFFHKYKGPFKKLIPIVVVKQDAERCINFATENVASFDKKAGESWFKMSVIKSAGAVQQKLQIPTLLWLLIGVNIILGFLSLIMSTGRVAIV